MTRHLTLPLILAIHDQAGLAAVRDHGLLDSAITRPRTTVFGEEAYPTLDEKVAVVLESIVRNHPLIDGNKRLGWLAATVLYGLNNVHLAAPHDAAYDLVIGVAEGRVEYRPSAARLASWSMPPSTSTST